MVAIVIVSDRTRITINVRNNNIIINQSINQSINQIIINIFWF